MVIKKVIVLGHSTGNLWDVFQEDVWKARVSYEGNTLVICRGYIHKKDLKEAEKIIEVGELMIKEEYIRITY